ncbi:hypothetical protein LI294_21000 [bacterium 210702-DFI.5.13]|nr:hypothetical protein [bacterium 210702-DFI.5.13]
MTRGNFLLITNTANWMSIQFNGDMYPSCNGKIVYHMLESVETYDDLTAAILKFDKERFGYSYEYGEDMTPKSISDNIDFSKDYYAVYNSDYLYIKNASDEDCTIIAKNEMEQTIKPGEIQVWNFGCLVQPDDEDLELDDDEKKFVYGNQPKGASSKPKNDKNNIVYGDQPEETSLDDRLQTIFSECDSLLENLPKGLTNEEKEMLPPVVALWSALKKYLEK